MENNENGKELVNVTVENDESTACNHKNIHEEIYVAPNAKMRN